MKQQSGLPETYDSMDKDRLTMLARDKKVQVRLAVASNSATPTEILKAMAGDPSRTVRRALAARTDAPGELLRELARDSDLKTRQALTENVEVHPHRLVVGVLGGPADQRLGLVQQRAGGSGITCERVICAV
ncbi:hypothetical protein [Streptosporangium sp. CA-115845]|uniref:hypothetical protein n=1 Tax=Streptosporangium sp. CA-115845 TaxID=3240071 RepID=UPI003D8A94E3